MGFCPTEYIYIYMKEHKLMRLGQKAYRKRKKEERKRV
jgi:hypothetical protein